MYKNLNATKVVSLFVLLSSPAAFGVNLPVAAGAFQPETSNDAAYINNWGSQVFNTDTANGHWVTASLGVYNGLAENAVFVGTNNGSTFECWVTVTNQSTLASNTYSNSVTTNGVFSLTVTIPSGLTQPRAISAECLIPAWNSSGSYLNLVK